MAVNVNKKIGKLGPVQRKKVEARAAKLIKEEMTLRQPRRARRPAASGHVNTNWAKVPR
jgi:hypothetical protein